MKYLIIVLLVISCNDKGDTPSVNAPHPDNGIEVEVEAEDEELEEDRSEDHLDPDASDELDHQPMGYMGDSKFETIDKKVSQATDLEVGQVGRDFHIPCNVFRTEKGMVVKCDPSPCSKLGQAYLQTHYTSSFIYIKRQKRTSYFRRRREWIRQGRWERCDHKQQEKK